jgi:hypothetical protein
VLGEKVPPNAHLTSLPAQQHAHPHRIVLVCDDYRRLAARVVGWDDVEGVRMLPKESDLLVETRQPDAFYGRLPSGGRARG